MTQYEQRLQNDLDALRQSVGTLATHVESNLRDAVRALLTLDADLAYRTILKDHPVNRIAEDVEAQAHRFIARHLPSAGHLRFVSSVMRVVVLLERMGDYAVTIGRETVQLERPLEGTFRDEVQAMAQDSLQMFSQAMMAFRERDVSLARGTMGFADQVDRDFSVAFNLLVGEMPATLRPTDLFGRLIVITQLERVSDQAKNLCEETIFALTGETKKRRPVRVLFLDRNDAADTQMAVAIGRKRYGDRGVFRSAGSDPSPAVDPSVISFMEAHGFDLSAARPSAIDWPDEDWADFDVIVTLDGSIRDYLGTVPFHTVALAWEPAGDGQGADLPDRYRELSQAIGDLIDTMRAPAGDADAK
jgi:phosphate transport system protein